MTAYVLAGLVAAAVVTASEPPLPVELGPDLQVTEPLLVGTTWTEGQADRLIAWAEKALEAPVRQAIVTHWHNDRTGSLAALHRRRIPVATLDLTVAKLRDAGIGALPGVPMKTGAGAQASGPGYEAFYPGAGHTVDNIIVWFPQARIVFDRTLDLLRKKAQD